MKTLLLIALDWAPAFRGAIINLVMLVLLGLTYAFPSLVK